MEYIHKVIWNIVEFPPKVIYSLQNKFSFLYWSGYVISFENVMNFISPDLETVLLNGIYIDKLKMAIKIFILFGSIGDVPSRAKRFKNSSLCQIN